MSCSRHQTFKEDDRYFIDSKQHNNCCLCFCEAHPDGGSINEVGKCFGLTGMRILQLERIALEKLKKRINFYK